MKIKSISTEFLKQNSLILTTKYPELSGICFSLLNNLSENAKIEDSFLRNIENGFEILQEVCLNKDCDLYNWLQISKLKVGVLQDFITCEDENIEFDEFLLDFTKKDKAKTGRCIECGETTQISCHKSHKMAFFMVKTNFFSEKEREINGFRLISVYKISSKEEKCYFFREDEQVWIERKNSSEVEVAVTKICHGSGKIFYLLYIK